MHGRHAHRLLTVLIPGRNERRSGQVRRENLKQQMLADLAGFVDDSVADITRLKEVVLIAIHDRFVGHDILHLPHRLAVTPLVSTFSGSPALACARRAADRKNIATVRSCIFIAPPLFVSSTPIHARQCVTHNASVLAVSSTALLSVVWRECYFCYFYIRFAPTMMKAIVHGSPLLFCQRCRVPFCTRQSPALK
jgi:hypothetical protein